MVAWIHLRIPFVLILTISIYVALSKCQMLLYTLHIYCRLLDPSRTLWNRSYHNPCLRWEIKGKRGQATNLSKVSPSGRAGVQICTLCHAYSARDSHWGAWKEKVDSANKLSHFHSGERASKAVQIWRAYVECLLLLGPLGSPSQTNSRISLHI